jgi:hypothetical protein
MELPSLAHRLLIITHKLQIHGGKSLQGGAGGRNDLQQKKRERGTMLLTTEKE